MGRKGERDKELPLNEDKVGGFAFFASFMALILFDGLAIYSAPRILADARYLSHWLWFTAGFCLGHLIAKFCIKGHPSVLLHEWKHSVVSTLVGNKWKALKVESRSGHFEYAYSKKNARFNAFISLAPYWLPLFTFVTLMAAYAALYPSLPWITAVVGLGFGADLTLNLRDISPIQSDLTEVRGGYGFSLAYIAAINLFLFLMLALWVSDSAAGFKTFGLTLLEVGSQLRDLIRS